MKRRIYRWLNPGLLGQARQFETSRVFSDLPRWRWLLARLTFHTVRAWRIRTGYYERRKST